MVNDLGQFEEFSLSVTIPVGIFQGNHMSGNRHFKNSLDLCHDLQQKAPARRCFGERSGQGLSKSVQCFHNQTFTNLMEKFRFATFLVFCVGLFVSCRNENAPIGPADGESRAGGVVRTGSFPRRSKDDMDFLKSPATYTWVSISPWAFETYPGDLGTRTSGAGPLDQKMDPRNGGGAPDMYNEVSGEGFDTFYYDRSILSAAEAEEFAAFASIFGTEDTEFTDPPARVVRLNIRGRVIDTPCEKNAVAKLVNASRQAALDFHENFQNCYNLANAGSGIFWTLSEKEALATAFNQLMMKGGLHHLTKASAVATIGPTLVIYGVVLNVYTSPCITNQYEKYYLKMAQIAMEFNQETAACG